VSHWSVGESDWNRFVVLVERVIHNTEGDVLGRHARGKGQRAGCQRVIHSPARAVPPATNSQPFTAWPEAV